MNWRRRASSASGASRPRPCGRSYYSSCRPAASTTTRAVCAELRWAGNSTPTPATFAAWRQPPGSLRHLIQAARPRGSPSESIGVHLARRPRPARPDAPVLTPDVRPRMARVSSSSPASDYGGMEADEANERRELVRARAGVHPATGRRRLVPARTRDWGGDLRRKPLGSDSAVH